MHADEGIREEELKFRPDAELDVQIIRDGNHFRLRAAAIIIRDDKILMTTNSNATNYYTVGGGVQFAESLEEAVIRETAEETGAVLEVEKFLGLYEEFSRGRGYLRGLDSHLMVAYFLMKDSPELDKVNTGRRTDEYMEWVEWVDIEEARKDKGIALALKMLEEANNGQILVERRD